MGVPMPDIVQVFIAGTGFVLSLAILIFFLRLLFGGDRDDREISVSSQKGWKALFRYKKAGQPDPPDCSAGTE